MKDTNLEDIDFQNKSRILSAVNKNVTFKELSEMTQGEFLREFNLGRKSLKIVREVLLKYNLDFKGERHFV